MTDDNSKFDIQPVHISNESDPRRSFPSFLQDFNRTFKRQYSAQGNYLDDNDEIPPEIYERVSGVAVRDHLDSRDRSPPSLCRRDARFFAGFHASRQGSQRGGLQQRLQALSLDGRNDHTRRHENLDRLRPDAPRNPRRPTDREANNDRREREIREAGRREQTRREAGRREREEREVERRAHPASIYRTDGSRDTNPGRRR